MHIRSLVVSILACIGILASGTNVSAGPLRLVLSDYTNSTHVTAWIEDNGLGDSNPAVGAVTYTGALGEYSLNVSTGLSRPSIGDDGNSILDFSSVNVTSTGPGRLWMSLEDAFYSAGIGGSVITHSSIGGTLNGPEGSTFTANSWLSPMNDVPTVVGDTAAQNTSYPVLPTTTFGPGAFNAEEYGLFAVDGFYSMFSEVNINLTGPGLVSFDLNTSAVPVPEPGSLLLFGTGLLGVARLARRRLTLGNPRI
jgi:PEP-CTERM motif-containing protein